MYDWHAKHPEKGDRFRRAMRGVSKCKFAAKARWIWQIRRWQSHVHILTAIALDPADSLIRRWFERSPSSTRTNVVEIGGRYGFASISLAAEKPELAFEIRCDSQDFLHRGKALVAEEAKARIAFTHIPSLFDLCPPDDSSTVLVYVVRNVLWNWTDDEAIKLLQTLIPTLRAAPSIRIVVTDGVSPLSKEYPPHVEIAYRRRDITTMIMHNVKQRTQVEWLRMFAQVDPALKVCSFDLGRECY